MRSSKKPPTTPTAGSLPMILAPIEIQGVDAFADWWVTLKLRIKTLPITAEGRILQMLKKLWVLPVDIRLSAHSNQLRFRPRSYSYIGAVPMLESVSGVGEVSPDRPVYLQHTVDGYDPGSDPSSMHNVIGSVKPLSSRRIPGTTRNQPTWSMLPVPASR